MGKKEIREQALKELTKNILPYWQNLRDEKNGGFYGETDFHGTLIPTAVKGSILNARVLWTFSAAARVLGERVYLDYAKAAFDFLRKYFYDVSYGGLFWSVEYDGTPLDTKKQFYNLAFGIYGLAEYYRVTEDEKAKALAVSLFDTLEKYAYEPVYGGYTEALARDYSPLADMSLSAKDLNCPKSMNTNLHVMEAYTNLARIYEPAKEPLKNLLIVTLKKIVDEKKRFKLFFENDFTSLTKNISYGHDIEGSWLLYEAAEVLGDPEVLSLARETALTMAEEVYENGRDSIHGGLFNERDKDGDIHPQIKAWWPQAEAVVGFYNAYSLTKDEKYLAAAADILEYIDKVFVDHENGEWFNETTLDNIPLEDMPKAGFWKCPYHNGRMCLELIERIGGEL
ncbi:cellobiose 2-epimerase [Clostridia bacterium]|nr:cellobiose 2-epimerase [Clostridia bacterium]